MPVRKASPLAPAGTTDEHKEQIPSCCVAPTRKTSQLAPARATYEYREPTFFAMACCVRVVIGYMRYVYVRI